jgi:hypothetical protein
MIARHAGFEVALFGRRVGNWSCTKRRSRPMTSGLVSHPSPEGAVMIIVSESAATLKGFLAHTGLNELARMRRQFTVA